MSENEIKLVAVLREGCVCHSKRWSGDTHDDLGGSIDQAATDALMLVAASAIDRLTAERDSAVAEADRVEAEYDNALRKLSLAVAEGKGLVAALDRIASLKMSMFKDPCDMIGECGNIAAHAIAARAGGGV